VKTFRALYNQKLQDPAFKCLFDQECHVCTHTMAIFHKALEKGLSPDQLALDLGVDPQKIHDLADADHCDPPLTFRLCRHLNLPVPEDCPRMMET
jgi:hypothetical protein